MPGLALLLMLGLMSLLPSPASAEAVFPRDAVYVWQRVWTIDVHNALIDSQADFGEVHYLAGQWGQHWAWSKTDGAVIASLGGRAIPVFRLDGRDNLQSPDVMTGIVEYVAHSRAKRIELDYDCPDSRLPAYRQFIGVLRQRLAAGTLISITALPDWLNSSSLRPLLQEADSSILQVHGVQAPSRPLFDPRRASMWIKAWARETTRPFRVALPTYGIRLHWTGEGVMVEAERSLAMGEGMPIVVDPAALATWLPTQPSYPNFQGYIWFRLPLAHDHASWSLPTLRAVMQGHYHVPPPRVVLKVVVPGHFDVVLHNPAGVDIMLPSRIFLPGCHSGDGSNRYREIENIHGLELQREQERLLRAGDAITVGWVICRKETYAIF